MIKKETWQRRHGDGWGDGYWYFEELLNVAGQQYEEEDEDGAPTDTVEDGDLTTEDDILQETKKMKSGKSPGLDSISAVI